MSQTPQMAEPLTDMTGTDCLLIVDDQEANLQVMGAMLNKLGFEILPATNGEQALRRLAARRPDLILMDVLMPGMDGFALCRTIQENPAWADIPIIFLSAADDKNLVVRALESGGVDYITKPFNKLELVSRVRTQLMLKTTRDHLKRLAQDNEEMLGMISHQLQNHFAGVEMSTQLLINRFQANTDPNFRLMAENIRGSCCQMRLFVRSFLANAAVDHRLTVTLGSVDLASIAAQVAKRYEDAANAKAIGLRAVLAESAPAVRADHDALVQVLDNLISNAVKFSPPGKEVLVTVQQNANQMECRVKDQGPGFTKEDRVRMFGRYARLSARPTAGEPTTGLGLSIAQKLTQAMSGELICESEPGQGAAFILRLPLERPKKQRDHEFSGN
jgi:two-component system sensor histidine kinase/response regulator